MRTFSQAGQELWVREILDNKQNGFFVEVGAYDGVQLSNTFFLEKELNWNGICIEANSEYFSKLETTRNSININKAVMDYKGFCKFEDMHTYKTTNPGPNTVECDTLHSILLENNCPKDIDYMSLDIEGHELVALESLDFNMWNITLFTIEHNLYLGDATLKNSVYEFMVSKGYERTVENVFVPNHGPVEDWYQKKTT